MRPMLSRLSLIGVGGTILPSAPLVRTASVSVVIPCYNYGRFLAQCIWSVTHRQPGIDLDIVIVDDCSTDDSLAVAKRLQRADKRIRIIAHKQNQGHITTYNDGLEAAKGEFVLLLSADDMVTPGALTRSAALLMAHENVGIVYGNAIHFSGEVPDFRATSQHWIVWKGHDWLRARCRSGYNVVASPEVMMRRSVLKNIGLYRPEIPHAGDFEMWLRASAVADVGFLVGVDQAYYRHHGVNMNSQTFSSGTDTGRFFDLEQRMLSFNAVFTGVGRLLPDADELFETARRTMASQAMHMANYAYARGNASFPYDQFIEFADRTFPDIRALAVGRAFARRTRLGLMPYLPLHPLWAPAAIAWRLWEIMRRWRRYRVGV